MSIKSNFLCPVSDRRINERVARINGIITVLLIVVFVLSRNIIPVDFLAADFFLRSFDFSEYSLIAVSSKGIVKYLRLYENLINAGPKIFAARIGFVFSSLIIISILLSSYIPAYSLAGILGIFSFLEGFFGICVACEIYPFVHRIIYRNLI